MLFATPIGLIDEERLLALRNTAEGRQLEYKQQLPGKGYDDVVEFLKDVTAMANTIGGDILYGITEGKAADGNTVAIAVDGIAGEDADKVKQRFENSIRENVKPRLIGLRIEARKLSSGNQVFIVRVPRSWNAPHVVHYQKHWRFYYRNSSGSHPMDVTELRQAILSTDNVSQRLEEFRFERLTKIASDETLGVGAKVILHLQSFNSLDPGNNINVADAKRLPREFLSEYYGGVAQRINYDGWLEYGSAPGGRGTYLQIFRSGKIEAVSSELIKDKALWIKRFEQRLIKTTQTYLDLLRNLGADAPIMLHLSLIGVNEFKLRSEVHAADVNAERSPIERDQLILPGELIQDFDEKPEKILHRSFDIVWNAAGFEKSLNYDDDENWIGLP